MSNESSVLLTVRGTYGAPSAEAARKLHNETAGSEPGIAAARSLGDLSHKVYLPATSLGANNGAKEGEVLFIDTWEDPSGLQKFFSDKNVQEQGGKLFKSRDPVVWMPARGSYSFHLPAGMGKNDRYVGLLRATVRSPEDAIGEFRAMISRSIRDARRRGQMSHELFVRLAMPGDASPPEILGVDVWTNLEGMLAQYKEHMGLGASFAAPPTTSIWQQPEGSWSEW